MSEAQDRQRRRLQAIQDLDLLGRTGDPVLTRLSRMAGYVTGASSAAVHILDADTQHRVAASGAALNPLAIEHSMCRLVVESGQPLVYPDGTIHPHFRESPGTRGPDGQIRFYAAVPLHVGDGSVVGTLCAFDPNAMHINGEQIEMLEDLADLVRAHLELVRVATVLGRAATTDALTGAVNRTMFQDRVATALARRPRRGTDVLVVMLDVDDFKLVNDTLGHDTGDQVLRWLADRVRLAIRDEDTLGRLGGDEFAVVAEVRGDAAHVVDQLHAALGEPRAPVSVTLGAALAQDGDDVRSLLIRADEAMYHAKRARQSARAAMLAVAVPA